MMDTSDQDTHPPSEESPPDQLPEPTEWLWPAYPSDLEARDAERQAAASGAGQELEAEAPDEESAAEEVEAPEREPDADLVEAVEEPPATKEPVVEEAASEAVAVLLGRVAEDEPAVVGPAAEDAVEEEPAGEAPTAEPEPEAQAEPPAPPPEQVGWLESAVPVAEPATAPEPEPAATEREPGPAAAEPAAEEQEPERAEHEREPGPAAAAPTARQAATSEPVAPETEPAPPEPGTPEPAAPEPEPTTPEPGPEPPEPEIPEPSPGPEPGPPEPPPEPGQPEPAPPEPATPEPEPGVPEPAALEPAPVEPAEPKPAEPEPAAREPGPVEPAAEPEPVEPVGTLAPGWTGWGEPSGWGRPAAPATGWGAPADSVDVPEAPETVEPDWAGATGWVRPAPLEPVPTEPAPPELDEPLEVEWVEAEVVDPGPADGEVATTTVRPGELPLPIPLTPPVPRDAVTPTQLAPSPPYQPLRRELGWTLPPPAPAPTWGQPTVRPAPRRQGWIIALALLVVAALLAAGLVWLVPGLRTAGVLNPASGDALSSAARSVGATSARADPATAVKPVLAVRARAVLRHDRAAFLATIDQRRTTFYRAQAALFDRMITVPFSDLAYQVAAPARDLSNARVRRSYAPSRVYLSEVEASYRFRGQDSEPATSHYYYTFTLTSAGWRLAGQGDLPAPRTGDVEIWDTSPVRSLATARALVVYHPGDRALAQRLLNAAEKGFGQVDASWPEWDHKVVILVPRDQAEAERLLHGRDLSDTAAVSASHVEAGPLRRVLGNRVIVNTTFMKGYGTLAVQLVMTHEMTHVATRNVGLGVPLFLVEGFADYTAWRSVDLPPRVTRQALAVTVRDGTFDGRLPTDNEIVGPNGALAYDKASSFCLWVSRTYGQAKLQRLYGSFSSFRERATAQEVDEQMRRTLGISLATAQSRWAAFVRQVM